MKKTELTNLSGEQRKYVDWLEAVVYGATELQTQLSFACHVLAQDLETYLGGGDGGRLKLLSGDKDDKIFERLVVMIKNRADFAAASILPVFAADDNKAVTKKLKIAPGGNAFEQIIKEVKAQQNG